MTRNFKIRDRTIGHDCPPYFIAEMSGNHNGAMERAFAIIKAAKEAGADAVKLQTYTAGTMTIDHDGDHFKIKKGLWAGRTLYDLYQEAMTPWQWHGPMFDYAKELDITIFSSPFDRSAVDFLEGLDAPAYKIASFEMIDLPLVKYVAETGKPVIISTGMATFQEIQDVIKVVKDTGNDQVVILHCVSGYPSQPSEANLRTMQDIAGSFDVFAGLSDHTLGIAVPVAATMLGAVVIEKHFTLSREEGGVDSAFSLEPQEFGDMTRSCREAFAILGSVDYGLKQSEVENRKYRRSLYVTQDIRKGACFSRENIRSIRPGFGIEPRFIDEVMGKAATKDITRGTALSWDMIS
ncbi:N-acetylneuraminate synthase [hydrothermal vent metagenome]|uniref:N-acetylneuraminate synthase n=1 Tax=hydrothermal vent metagenome TaxID=652676 RepID=A0A3B0SXP6_9ZZZZ